MSEMLARFIKLKTCLTKALLDLKLSINFSQDEWNTLDELHAILDIIKTIVESLCRRDASLLNADIAIKYALKKTACNKYFLEQRNVPCIEKQIFQTENDRSSHASLPQ